MIEMGGWAFWRGTLALIIGSFMVFANVYVTQPLLPMIAREFAISELQAASSFTITTLTLGLSLLFYGPLSDALGRKKIMLLTLLGVTLTTFALSFAKDYSSLLFLRALQGFFLAGLPAIAVAYLGDEYRPHAMAIAVGLYISGNTLGGIGGRLIGGFVGEWQGTSAAFLTMALVSLLCFLLFWVLLPNSQHFEAKRFRVRTIVTNVALHVRNPMLLLCYLIGGFNFFIFINQYSYITFVLEDEPYSLSAKFVSLLFLTYLSGTVGSAFSGKLASHMSQPRIMSLGTGIVMLGSLVTLGSSLMAIVLGLFINCFGFFLCHSTASSFVSKNAQQAKASASSLYLVFYYLGASVGGFYLDPFWQMGGWPAVVMGSWCVLGAVFVLTLLLGKRHAQQVTAAATAP
ncbi:Inner membrane transport protein YnfM [Marinomonas aquimarina]|uniref:Inner membrane transport protein YnfM n=1 Tax=Marinomonas aquimarina TaxID=295068 RepID=A0A1A8T6K0_9GAMM|nr:MFS transporter [Marinomonas aquimarina]SBS26934.1 Inner membrane transport protein YnfM [Marinomonas aquimarina]